LIIPGEWERADDHAGHDRPAMSYSPQEILYKKDFADMIDRESEDVCQVIMALAQELGLRLGRRWRTRGKGTQVDLRGSIRASLRHGGELLALRKKRRQPKKTRFVVLCDVSGSMDSYSRFLLQFMYGFQRHVPRVETFVFSTRLTRITPHLRMRKIEAAYELISESVSHWSGGTRIGNSLAQYNKRYGRKYSGPNTVFVLLSDGWDQGATALLEREMKELRRRVKRLMWLNPLLGMPDYRPIDRGMRTALPHVEDFLDCHNLDELEAFGRKLEKV
ncbi:VWA domain-containing protein, partial [Patescibacteria group bacterium]|nr:VWA domain-containing protein [Pseudomonadota bacterium]MBU1932028.1 VWA domain-containing protein [Patescibacteria group bacterium]